MMRTGSLLLSTALTAGALLWAVRPACAADPGIHVYTWTDASGITHFSDMPRHNGSEKTLILPTPPPPNQTAIAADHAWLRQLDRDSQAQLAQEAAHRRAERQAEAVAAQRQREREVSTQYWPVFYSPWYDRRHRHGHRHRHPATNLPSARFPSNALPSSFPDPLASSFPPGLPSSFPEEQPSPPRRH